MGKDKIAHNRFLLFWWSIHVTLTTLLMGERRYLIVFSCNVWWYLYFAQNGICFWLQLQRERYCFCQIRSKMYIPAQHPHGKYQALKVNTVIKEDSDSGCTWVRQNWSITQSLSLIAKAGSRLLERRATPSVGISWQQKWYFKWYIRKDALFLVISIAVVG